MGLRGSGVLGLGVMGFGVLASGALASGCGGGDDEQGARRPPNPVGGGSGTTPTVPACAEAGGSAEVAAPTLALELFGDSGYGWLGSPAIADLDGDGTLEIVAAHEALVAWHADGSEAFRYEELPGRVWASPLVADFRDGPELEVVFASREQIVMLDSTGAVLSGWPVTWQDEVRSLAAGDVNGDGQLDVVAASTDHEVDILAAYSAGGDLLAGYPPVATGTIGCDAGENCWMAGAFDQNLAVGDLDGDAELDVVAPMDNAYAGIYHGSGEAFDANPMFEERPKTPGVRYLHTLSQAQQGWADDEATELQAHFTNTPPAIADLDGDGTNEVVMLASVQNASQDDREQGVALWVVRSDASRLPGWETPFHAPEYLFGLWDFEEDNAVAATNQVTVADLDPTYPGPELVFAGFDGRIHAVTAAREELWATYYAEDERVLTGGVVVGDLSADGVPELVFATYSPDEERSSLFVLDAGGNVLHRLPLPQRGASVPTLADVDGDGEVEIVLALRSVYWDGSEAAVQIYDVPGSTPDCLLWPTGRANLLRNGWVRAASP
ncbi:MAG TPA: VCBS repeat-containing protein [Polyangiaceae bacterium]|nr:VCBS repeat-containing protein [Polyangiaceae bacterium]